MSKLLELQFVRQSPFIDTLYQKSSNSIKIEHLQTILPHFLNPPSNIRKTINFQQNYSFQLQIHLSYITQKYLMIAQSDHEKVTLQQYLQTYNIRKKIEQRKRSKEKHKDPMIKTEQQQRMDGTFATVDRFFQQTKIELEDILINTDIHRQKVFYYLSKVLDDLMIKLKEEISKMYKDVYLHYLIESNEGQDKVNKEAGNYFKEKMTAAIEEKKKANIGEVIKENFKKEEKNAFITKLIIGDILKPDTSSSNQNKKVGSPKKDANRKVETVRQKVSEGKESLSGQKNSEKKDTQQKITNKQTASKQEAPQPRGNSFMQALFGLVQKQEQKAIAAPPLQLASIPSQIQANLPAMTPKESKLGRPFERKQSVKEMLRSPKANKLLKGVSPR